MKVISLFNDYLKNKNLLSYVLVGLLILIVVMGFFNRGLGLGLFVDLLLLIATFFIVSKSKYNNKELYVLLAIGFFIHLAVVLLIYFTGFKPVGGGGDYDLYNSVGREIARRFWHGEFSLDGLFVSNGFGVVIGVLYILTMPLMIIANLFIIWFFVIALLLIYLIVIEISKSRVLAFLVGILAIIYPSYLYLGSLVLKDTLVIPLVLIAMLLNIRMIKSFSWMKFIMFFVILSFLILVRFYIGYAMLFSFLISWFLVSTFVLKKRVIYGLLFLFLLGFSPQIVGNGYYGLKTFQQLFNFQTIDKYREIAYNPFSSANQAPSQSSQIATAKNKGIAYNVSNSPSPKNQVLPQSNKQKVSQSKQVVQIPEGDGSSFVIKTGFSQGLLSFSVNYFMSFIYSLLGPFPWQLRYHQQMIALLETIPWYCLILISLFGIVRFIKKKGFLKMLQDYRFCLPLLLFGIIALGALSLYINNYGIIVRIRMPMFICFLSVMFVIFSDEIENYYKITYEKIFSYWRSRLHRL